MGTPRDQGLQGIYIGLFLFTTLVVGIRVYARSKRDLQWSKPDLAIWVAWLLALVIVAVCCVGAGSSAGWGKHLSELSLAQLSEGLKMMWVFEILYNPAMTAIRISILLFYLQINPERRFRLVVYAAMAFCGASSFTAMMVFVFQCNPPSFFWTRTGDGKCLNAYVVFLVNAIVNLATDVWVLTIPIPMVWRLRIATQQKVALSAVFAVGLLACAAACVRFYYIRFVDTTDPMFDAVHAGIWSYVEIATGITCASLPALRSLISFPRRNPTARSKSKPSFLSWSNQSGHRRLPGDGGLDGSASDRELVVESDFIDQSSSGNMGSKAVVLQNVERANGGSGSGGAERGSMLPAPLAANSAAHRQSPALKDIEAGITPSSSSTAPAGIKVDTSISVYNSSKS